MFNAVIEAQEQEQHRIARDLHDHLGPSLSIIKAQVDSIDDSALSDEDKSIKNDVSAQMQSAITDVRSIAHNLIPKTFTEYGFIRSVKYYILRISEYNTIKINCILPEWPDNIEKSYEITVYRIIQELFQNTLKHSGASIIDLEMNIVNSLVSLKYADNGKGFTSDIKGGIGIKSITTRSKLLYGTFSFGQTVDKGMCFKLQFNLKKLYAS